MAIKKKLVSNKDMDKKQTATTPQEKYTKLWGGIDNDKAHFAISEKQDVVVSINRNNEDDILLADLRIHVRSPKYTGLTGKGFSIPASLLPKLKDAVDRAWTYACLEGVNKMVE